MVCLWTQSNFDVTMASWTPVADPEGATGAKASAWKNSK